MLVAMGTLPYPEGRGRGVLMTALHLQNLSQFKSTIPTPDNTRGLCRSTPQEHLHKRDLQKDNHAQYGNCNKNKISSS